MIGGGTAHIQIVGLETSFCATTNCAGVLVNTTGAIVNIVGIDCLNSFTFCVYDAAGADVSV